MATGTGGGGAPPMQSLFLVIVGKNEPLYEAEFLKRGAVPSSDAVTRQNYFVLHSALDLVENVAWTTNQMFLKVVDKVNHQQVSCYLTAGNIKFMLLHGGKNEDSIKNFFQEVYELYVKVRCLLCFAIFWVVYYGPISFLPIYLFSSFLLLYAGGYESILPI